ncbi:MAG: hypothetical protein ACKVUT_10590 [Gaiella sp.]
MATRPGTRRFPARRPAVAAAAALALVVGAGFVAGTPWIFADEVIYAELARSFAEDGRPALRGATSLDYGIGYPFLIAPAWLITSNGETAIAVARLIGIAAMVSTAVPATLLARRFLPLAQARAVGTLAVLVPSLAYTTTLMTEVAFYPVFTWGVWALVRALDRGRAGDQALAVVLAAVAATVKVLGIVLVPILLAATLLLAAMEGRVAGAPAFRVRLRRFAAAWAVSAVALVGGLTALGFAGRSPLAVFGAYAEAIRAVGLLELPLSTLWQVGALVLLTAVLPVAVLVPIQLSGWSRRSTHPERVLASVGLPLVLGVGVAVAVFAGYSSTISFAETGVPPSAPVFERNVFVVVPILLIGLWAWLGKGAPRRRAALAGVVGAAALAAAHPWDRLPDTANPQNLAALPWLLPAGPGTTARVLATVAALAVGLGFLSRRNVLAGAAKRAVAVWFGVVGALTLAVFVGHARVVDGHSNAADPAWIDRAVPAGADVALLWSDPGPGRFAPPSLQQDTLWLTEVFNDRVRRVLVIDRFLAYGPKGEKVVVSDGIVSERAGVPVAARYVVAPCALAVGGRLLARDVETALELVETDGQIELTGAVREGCPS